MNNATGYGAVLGAAVVLAGCSGAGSQQVASNVQPTGSARAAASSALPPATAISVEPTVHVNQVQRPFDEPFWPGDDTSFSQAILDGLSAQVAAPVKAYAEARAVQRKLVAAMIEASHALSDCGVAACADKPEREAALAKAAKEEKDARAKLRAALTTAVTALDNEEKRLKEQTPPAVLIALAAVLDARAVAARSSTSDSSSLQQIMAAPVREVDPQRFPDQAQAKALLDRVRFAVTSDDALGAEARYRLAKDLVAGLTGPVRTGVADGDKALTKSLEFFEAVAASKSGIYRDRCVFDVALVYMERADDTKAEGPLMTLANRAGPYRARAQYALGTLRHHQGKWEEALSWFVRALDTGFAPKDLSWKWMAAEAAADGTLRKSVAMNKAAGGPSTARDGALSLTTPEMASIKADVFSTIALHFILQAADRGDMTTAVEAARILVDRAPEVVEAPLGLKLLVADAAHRGDTAQATKLRQRLTTQYGPTSDWASALRKQAGRYREADLRVAQVSAEPITSGASEGGTGPGLASMLTIHNGVMSPFEWREVKIEEQLARLLDHCVFPFVGMGSKGESVRMTFSVKAAAKSEPMVDIESESNQGIPPQTIACMRNSAFAFLRQLPAEPRNIQVTADDVFRDGGRVPGGSGSGK